MSRHVKDETWRPGRAEAAETGRDDDDDDDERGGGAASPTPLQAALTDFFAKETEEMGATTDFKTFSLPLARIKKIMKSDEDVRMISSETPALFSKACELFIQELTIRAWAHADSHKRRTLSRADVATAIAKTEVFDFLLDIVPPGEAAGAPKMEGDDEEAADEDG